MSERLKQVFTASPQGLTRLVAYVMAGDPDAQTSLRRLKGLAAAGVDVLELGIPFSDPMADGPVIQTAGERALKGGMNVKKALELVRDFRQDSEIPLLLMSYLNPLLHFGWEDFIQSALEAGVDGLILPDLPWREGRILRAKARAVAADLAFVPILAQTSQAQDISHLKDEEGILREQGSFVYVLAKNGITGGEAEIPLPAQDFIRSLKDSFAMPRCVGFGIQQREQVQRLAGIAEGVIVGSALVESFARVDAVELKPQERLAAENQVYNWLTDLKKQ